MVGYQPGYGEVADTWPQSSTASYRRIRILVLAAVKNDLALVAFATGPYHAFGPDFGPGPPSEPTWRSPWTWASTSAVFTGAVIRPGDLKRHHARAGGRNSAPAELVQTFVVDAEVVGHLVDDGDGFSSMTSSSDSQTSSSDSR